MFYVVELSASEHLFEISAIQIWYLIIIIVKPSHWVGLSPCTTQISGLSLTMRLPRLNGVGYIEILSAH